MKQTILTILTLISIQGFCQSELARINDSDGFVNVRVDKNTDSDIITTIKDGQFFFCEPSSENWWRIDNFYSNPDDTRKFILTQEFKIRGNYPGKRTISFAGS